MNRDTRTTIEVGVLVAFVMTVGVFAILAADAVVRHLLDFVDSLP